MFAELPGSAKAFYNSIMVESWNDLFEIVAFVKENFPFHSMYIDRYTIHGEETVLYCKP